MLQQHFFEIMINYLKAVSDLLTVFLLLLFKFNILFACDKKPNILYLLIQIIVTKKNNIKLQNLITISIIAVATIFILFVNMESNFINTYAQEQQQQNEKT